MPSRASSDLSRVPESSDVFPVIRRWSTDPYLFCRHITYPTVWTGLVDTTILGASVIYYVLKLVVSASLIVLISEIAKRSTGFAALVASLPLTSLLAFVWLGVEGAQPEKIAALSSQIFWLIVPSLVLFPLLAVLLRMGVNLWVSLATASAATAIAYLALLPLLRKFGLVD